MANTVVEHAAGIAREVLSDGIKLFVGEKKASLRNGQSPTGAALLVHGATYGGSTVYDVQAPGKDYSLMDYLAARGMDVFTFDVRGYGPSQKPDNAATM